MYLYGLSGSLTLLLLLIARWNWYEDLYNKFFETSDGNEGWYAFKLVKDLALDCLTAMLWPVALPYRFISLRKPVRLIASAVKYSVSSQLRLENKNPTGGEVSLSD